MTIIKDKARSGARIIIGTILLLSLLSAKLYSQSLDLNEAYSLLETNYPVLQNAGLNDQVLQANLDILDLERKPSLYLKGRAQLQSETTSLGSGENVPFSIDIPLYSARAYGEVNYTLSDGGRLDARKRLTAADGKLANQSLEVDRFSLRQRINQLFLGVLLNRERAALYETTLSDLRERKGVLAKAVQLGAVLESELLQLRVREVEIEANRDNIYGIISRLLANLSTLIGKPLPEGTQLRLPNLPESNSIPAAQRPEFKRFELQREAIMANNELIEANTKPIISAFAQAGVGGPNPLNLFNTNISPYALGGVSFQWKFKDWGKSQKQTELLGLQAAKLHHQEETFRFNLNAGNEAYLADVARLRQQIIRDGEIVGLQAEILTQLSAQLDNGVITATDYLSQVNAELLARQQLKIHETELVQVQLNFLNERGSW
jgi:outer membrane protein TolC